jgi:protein TonB
MNADRLLVCALLLLVAPSSAAGPQTPSQAPPPAPRTLAPEDEAALLRRIGEDPRNLQPYFQLARLQEAAGRPGDAEITLLRARDARPEDGAPWAALAGLYRRLGRFDEAIAVLTHRAAEQPQDPDTPHLLATFYWDKAVRDATLDAGGKLQYVLAGLEAVDRALALKPTHVQALTYKNLLLRTQATLEADPDRRKALLAEADDLKLRAIQLQGGQPTIAVGGGGQAPAAAARAGNAPVRVGGSVRPPIKIHHVDAIYPDEARAAGLQGVVVCEITIDEAGVVSDAKVLRSVPLLDRAAVDAVKQWLFAPTILGDRAVPVIMTVGVTFSLRAP